MKIKSISRGMLAALVMAVTMFASSATSYAATIYSTYLVGSGAPLGQNGYATACNRTFNEAGNIGVSAYIRIKVGGAFVWSGTLAHNACRTVYFLPSTKGTQVSSGVYSGSTLIGGYRTITIYAF